MRQGFNRALVALRKRAQMAADKETAFDHNMFLFLSAAICVIRGSTFFGCGQRPHGDPLHLCVKNKVRCASWTPC